MALVNWNPVAAANFSESNALRLAAQQQLAGGIKGIGDTAVAFNDATGKANTDILLNSLVGQRTPEAAAAAIQAAKAQAGGMYNNYDQAAFRSAAEALPKSAADAQELDFQTADKPYLQAAALAYSRGDREAVGNFAKEIRSNAGRAELSKLIGDSQNMSVQDSAVTNAEGKLKEEIRSNKAKEAQAKIDGFTARIAAGRSGSGSSGKASLDRVIANARMAIQKAATDSATAMLGKTQDTPETKLAYQNAINGTKGERLDTWGNVDGKHLDEVLKTIPGYANAGAGIRAKVLDHLWAANTTQSGGGMINSLFSRDLSDQQIKEMGATALADYASNDQVNLARAQQVLMEKGVAQTRDWMDLHGISQDSLTDDQITALLTPGANAQPDTVDSPAATPKVDTKEAERILKDKAISRQKGEARKAAQGSESIVKATTAKQSSEPVTKTGILPARMQPGKNTKDITYTYQEMPAPKDMRIPPDGWKYKSMNPLDPDHKVLVTNSYRGVKY